MNTDITKGAPYYDDYDASKDYMKILPLPGRVAQSREFSQAQSIQLDLLKRLGESIMSNGSIIDGMGFTLDKDTNIVTISPGKVFARGIVHNYPGGEIEITKVGEETIGLKVESEIITEAEDKTLRDPAQGYANYAQPGAHRLKAVCTLALNDDSAYELYSFIDGILKIDPIKPQLDSVLELLARRTYDEAGNYKVEGLTIDAEERDEDTVSLNISAGKAYVLGFEVSKPAKSRIIVNKPTALKKVFNEPKTYSIGTEKYYFNNNPVNEILKSVAVVEVEETISRGSIKGGVDMLPNTPVVQIVSIKQGATVYRQGEDFQLIADGVDWSLSNKEPSVGTSYTVVYRHNKVLEQGVDYTLESEGEDTRKKYYINITGGGDIPVNNSQIVTDYSFKLARIDAVVLDRDGTVRTIPGQEDILRNVEAPNFLNRESLQLGLLLHHPDGTNPTAKNDSVEKLEMRELQQIVGRVKDMEYNQALSALDQEAINAEAGTNLKGIHSDGFASTTRGDLGHPDFSVAYNLREQCIELPIDTTSVSSPGINEETSKIGKWGRLVTAPYTEKRILHQPYATSEMNVNPYSVFTQVGSVSLNPAVDNWIDEEIVLEGERTTTRTVSAGGLSAQARARAQFPEIDSWTRQGSILGRNQLHGSFQSTVTRTISESAITNMRQREVTVHASNLTTNSDNLELLFDGKKVDLTPLSGTSRGTRPGTVRSNGAGEVKATFTVPKGVRTGTAEVTLRNPNNIAATSYTAEGTLRKVGQGVLITRVTINAVDPLAQSFSFSREQILSSVGLYFGTKDKTQNVIVQIRNMVNGFPGQQIHAERVLKPSEVKLSSDGSVETRVYFDSPVLCTPENQYCITILTDSNEYMMFVGELGEKDLKTETTVVKQPYNEGVLFSSSNAITWTPHQAKDLTMNIYTAEFEPYGVIEFDPITDIRVDKMMVLADDLTPDNTGCEWEFKISPDGEYNPISSYMDRDLGALVEFIQLRATFSATDTMSPILAIDSFNLMSFLTKKTGSYISRNTEMSQRYTEVKQIFEGRIPSGCKIDAQFSYDGGSTWVDATLESSQQVSQEFTQYTYVTAVDQGENAKQFKSRINISAPNTISRPQVRRLMNIIK